MRYYNLRLIVFGLLHSLDFRLLDMISTPDAWNIESIFFLRNSMVGQWMTLLNKLD